MKVKLITVFILALVAIALSSELDINRYNTSLNLDLLGKIAFADSEENKSPCVTQPVYLNEPNTFYQGSTRTCFNQEGEPCGREYACFPHPSEGSSMCQQSLCK